MFNLNNNQREGFCELSKLTYIYLPGLISFVAG